MSFKCAGNASLKKDVENRYSLLIFNIIYLIISNFIYYFLFFIFYFLFYTS
jgi:hypothetical protein